jgi:hypothetical protein
MRIHTNLTTEQMNKIEPPPSAKIHAFVPHGSRTHPRAFEVILSGSSRFRGQYGQADFTTATWDEWGIYLGRLFAADPEARIPRTYDDADHFHYITDGRYDVDNDPPLTKLCPLHRWTHVNNDIPGREVTQECRKCGAILRRSY